jgi:hypothetical protein
MNKPTPNYRIGQSFRLTSNARHNYGMKHEDKVYRVRQWFNAHGRNGGVHEHPGYDNASGDCLYEADGLNCAVYEWEMEAE